MAWKRPMILTAECNGIQEFHDRNGLHAGFRATGSIKRSEFGIDFKLLPIGMDLLALGDDVKIEIDVEFDRVERRHIGCGSLMGDRPFVVHAIHLVLLELPVLAQVATIGPKGKSQNNPVWLVLYGEYLFTRMDSTRHTLRNVQREPRVAVSNVDPVNPAHYLEIQGRVIKIDPEVNSPRLRRIVRKYTGAEEFPESLIERVVVVMEPIKTSQMG